MKHLGDMATQVAEELRAEHEREIAERPLPFEDDVNLMEKQGVGIFAKIKFSWSTVDKKIIEQIRAAADTAFTAAFDGAIVAFDRLYGQIRVPETNDSGVVMTDGQGRTLWVLDNYGKPVENWESLDGTDIERCLFDLARLRLVVAPQVNDLLMEAMFAKRISTDAHDDAHAAILDGTVQDKTSQANRKAREDRYHAFYRYWLWSQGDVFLKELSNFQRLLERTRDWGVRSQWNNR